MLGTGRFARWAGRRGGLLLSSATGAEFGCPAGAQVTHPSAGPWSTRVKPSRATILDALLGLDRGPGSSMGGLKPTFRARKSRAGRKVPFLLDGRA